MTAASRLGDVCSEVDTLFSDKAVLGLILPEGSRRWTSQDVFPGRDPRAYHVLPPALMRACWTPRARRISAMRATAYPFPIAPKSIRRQPEWNSIRSGGRISIFSKPTQLRNSFSFSEEGIGPPFIAAFHASTKGATLMSNSPPESRE